MPKIDWDAQPLGEVPDAKLAEQLGVSRQSVHKQRTARGIEPAAAEGRGRPALNRERFEAKLEPEHVERLWSEANARGVWPADVLNAILAVAFAGDELPAEVAAVLPEQR